MKPSTTLLFTVLACCTGAFARTTPVELPAALLGVRPDSMASAPDGAATLGEIRWEISVCWRESVPRSGGSARSRGED